MFHGYVDGMDPDVRLDFRMIMTSYNYIYRLVVFYFHDGFQGVSLSVGAAEVLVLLGLERPKERPCETDSRHVFR